MAKCDRRDALYTVILDANTCFGLCLEAGLKLTRIIIVAAGLAPDDTDSNSADRIMKNTLRVTLIILATIKLSSDPLGAPVT